MAERALKTWFDYRREVREFDAVLEYARAVSTSLVGKQIDSPRVSYAEQIFIKLLAHCIVLRRLSPDPAKKARSELWDVPSSSAVARCAIEAHDAFAYVVGRNASDAERSFRLMLWEAHDKTRRIKMLDAIGSTASELAAMRATADEMLQKLQAHPLYQALRRDLQRQIVKGDPPASHLSQRELCAECGVDFEYYTAVTMQLSQYVHTFPFSVRQLFMFRAGTLESLRMMSLPLQFVLPFLTRVTEGMRELFPGETPSPPSRTARSMTVWRSISAHGTKSAA
ncbi:hypothetical protein [Aquabacterium sp. J223]|uniref:hypothetical protein n=1 Tax=Aquabacterium sp. J223 TaxID=2898431 RepID=UPI0021ADAC7F|nr:hypothetical protein [Aquabacterium sp. J223]UUX95557.1 hypothetical protein LRS07_20525 [Aquabacterium sp. J223]